MGFATVQFQSSEQLESRLRDLNILF